MKAVATIMLGLVVLAAAAEARQYGSPAPAPAPAQGDDSEACLEAVMNNMITCVDYMVVRAAESKPDKACCTGTNAVLTAYPNCLCLALAEAGGYGLEVNITRAAALPSLCHISSPPALSKCLAAAEAEAPAPEAEAPEASAPVSSHKHKHESAPAPAPGKGAATAVSVSYGLMATVAMVVMAMSV